MVSLLSPSAAFPAITLFLLFLLPVDAYPPLMAPTQVMFFSEVLP
ncbi:unnamed protein product [Musa banksii]